MGMLGFEVKEEGLSRDFGTLMFVGRLNSFLGWVMVAGCAIAIIAGLTMPGNEGAISLIGGLCIPISLLVVASGQLISCLVSTERNSKDTSELLHRHTEILTEISSKLGKE